MSLIRIEHKLKTIFVFAFCFLLFASKAQRYNFKNYSAENGLPYVQIFTIFQDSKGYLWSGGYGGLSQFNGKEFKNYSPKNGLANHYVNTITENRNHEILIGTIDGLSVLKGNKIKNYHTKDGLPHKNITSLCVDFNGSNWIGTSNGLCLLKNDKIEIVKEFSNKQITYLYSSYKTGLWVGTKTGLYNYSEYNFTLYDVHTGLTDNSVNAIAENASTNELYIGTKNGLSVLNTSSKKTINYHVINGLLDEEINALTTTSEGVLWIGSKSGLIQFYKTFFHIIQLIRIIIQTLFVVYLWIMKIIYGLVHTTGCINSEIKVL